MSVSARRADSTMMPTAGLLPDLLAQLEAVPPGQHQVEQHHVQAPRLDGLADPGPVPGHEHVVAARGEVGPDQVDDVLVIFHDEDDRLVGHHVVPPVPPPHSRMPRTARLPPLTGDLVADQPGARPRRTPRDRPAPPSGCRRALRRSPVRWAAPARCPPPRGLRAGSAPPARSRPPPATRPRRPRHPGNGPDQGERDRAGATRRGDDLTRTDPGTDLAEHGEGTEALGETANFEQGGLAAGLRRPAAPAHHCLRHAARPTRLRRRVRPCP